MLFRSGVVLGLSGGIDSALTAVIAADALGPNRVTGVRMPSRFTQSQSQDDASALAAALGIRLETLAKTLREAITERDECLGAHAVNHRERTAGEWRKTETEDRADIRLAWVGDDVLLNRAGRLECLRREKALFQHGDEIGRAHV